MGRSKGSGYYNRQKVFDFIIRYKKENDGNSPTYREIANGIGIASVSNVGYILNDLEREGLIKIRRQTRKGSIMVTGGKWEYENRTSNN